MTTHADLALLRSIADAGRGPDDHGPAPSRSGAVPVGRLRDRGPEDLDARLRDLEAEGLLRAVGPDSVRLTPEGIAALVPRNSA